MWLPASLPGISWIVAYGQTPYGVHLRAASPWEFLIVYLGLPLALFGPSTFLMGFGFPVLQRATQRDPVGSGRTVGLLQAANIAGCALGSLFTGLVLLDRVDMGRSSNPVRGVADHRARGLARHLEPPVRMDGRGPAGPGPDLPRQRPSLAAAARRPGSRDLPGRRRNSGERHPAHPRGRAVQAVDQRPAQQLAALWLASHRHRRVPAIVHPNPVDVAVVGMGSGDTAWAASSNEKTERVVVFEIASSQPRLMSRVASREGMSRVAQFLADKRVTIVKDDGRRRLHADGRKYDIIVADAIDTDSTMSNNLYSVEFYRLVKDTLKPGGLMCVLGKTSRIRAAAQRAFPYAVAFREDLLLVSAEPIVIDKEAWLEKLRSPHLVDYFGKARTREIAEFVRGAVYAKLPERGQCRLGPPAEGRVPAAVRRFAEPRRARAISRNILGYADPGPGSEATTGRPARTPPA